VKVAKASLNKVVVGPFGAWWWCLSASLLLADHAGKEEREASRWVLVLPLLADRGGEEAGWCCASSAAALGRGLSLPSSSHEVRHCFLLLPGAMVV
jgi:hypothetical protein